jgi:uncharacterized protein YigE (DUF2233 family)
MTTFCRFLMTIFSVTIPRKGSVAVLFFILIGLHPGQACAWETLVPGLEEASFEVPSISSPPPTIAVLRIDPALFSFRLITQKTRFTKVATLEEWCREKQLVAAINASMYREDRQQSTGYMKTRGLVNNGYINPRFGAFFVFDPKAPSLPAVRIIDRKKDDWRTLITRYDTVIQNFRLISPAGANLWPENAKEHSIAAIAMDNAGNVLFIHCQTPLTVHAFNEALLDLPMDLAGAMYVEGGPEAAMYLNLENKRRSWMGQYENPLLGTISERLWPIPNIIGIEPLETNATGE